MPVRCVRTQDVRRQAGRNVRLVRRFELRAPANAEPFPTIVSEATNGADAIKSASDASPEIVLMDLTMPGIDGWQAARALKSDPRTRGITVIAVTAHALQPETDAARAAGCDGVICKPFDLGALARTIAVTAGPPRLTSTSPRASRLGRGGAAEDSTVQQRHIHRDQRCIRLGHRDGTHRESEGTGEVVLESI
jgi:CheY-like chemotaxis protein